MGVQYHTQHYTPPPAPRATSPATSPAEQLSPSVGLPAPVLATSLKRESYGILPISDAVINSQQRIADTFVALGLLPRAITVSDLQRKQGS